MANKQKDVIEDIMEELADIEHQRWSDWQRYLHSKLTYTEIPKELGGIIQAWYLLDASMYEHWERQIDTDYKDLTESEKESDREQVRRYLPLIEKALTKAKQQAKREVVEDVKKEMLKCLEEVCQYENNICKTLVNKGDVSVWVHRLGDSLLLTQKKDGE